MKRFYTLKRSFDQEMKDAELGEAKRRRVIVNEEIIGKIDFTMSKTSTLPPQKTVTAEKMKAEVKQAEAKIPENKCTTLMVYQGPPRRLIDIIEGMNQICCEKGIMEISK